MMAIIIGAVAGLLLLHSTLGLVVGGALGWAFSSARARRRAPPASDFVSPLFAVLGAVAKADGRVSQSEIAVAEHLMARMKLNTEQRHVAIEAFNRGKQPGFDTDAAVAQLRHWTAGRRNRAITIVDVVVETVLVEGPTEAKINLVRRIAATLHVSEMELMALMAMKGYAWTPGGGAHAGRQGPWHSWQAAGGGYSPPQRAQTGPDPYAILGVPRDSDERTIKRAYRKLISENHPDRLGDLPDDLRRRAEERAGEINAAYERIQSERGFK